MWVNRFWFEYCVANRMLASDSMTSAQFSVGSAYRSGSKGSHHIFTRDGVDEILNLQPRGSMAEKGFLRFAGTNFREDDTVRAAKLRKPQRELSRSVRPGL